MIHSNAIHAGCLKQYWHRVRLLGLSARPPRAHPNVGIDDRNKEQPDCVITIYGQREGWAPEIYAERRVES